MHKQEQRREGGSFGINEITVFVKFLELENGCAERVLTQTKISNSFLLETHGSKGGSLLTRMFSTVRT